MKTQELKPQIRFPNYTDEWKKMLLADVSSKPSYGMNAAAKEFDGTNIYLRITDIDETTGRLKKDKLTSPEGTLEEKFLLNKNDLLFARTGASTGKAYLYDETNKNVYYAGFLIKFNIETANPYLIYSYTKTHDYYKWVKTVSARSGQPGINAAEYSKLKIVLPKAESEQNRISTFLRQVDNLIENLTRQKEALEEYKKGVMQKIFSHEIRFKDENGKKYPDWKECRIDEILSKQSSNLSASSIKKNSGPYNVYGADGLYTQNDSYAIEEPYIGIVKDGAGVGRLLLCSEKSSVIGTLDILQQQSHYQIEFLFYLLKTVPFYKYKVGSTIPHIYFKDYSKYKTRLPSLEEQKKIASFLANLDSLISGKESMINKMKQWKKGLLQKMFV